jgi:hypothetical protein
MPLSFRQAGNLFVAGPNIRIYPSGNSYAISGSAPSTGGGFTGLTSAGTGQYLVASPITNNDLNYKSLSGSSNLSINDNDNGTLTFSLAGGGTGTIISGVNVGTNANSIGFFSGLSTTTNANDTLVFRNLLEGPNISITRSIDNDGNILIGRGPSTLVNQLSNIGGGARVLSAISATNLLIARTLLGSNGFTNSIVNNASTGATSAITASTVVRIAPTNASTVRFYISDSTSSLTTSVNFTYEVSVGIGINALAGGFQRLYLPAAEVNKSPLRLTPSSTEPTNPSNGSIWFSTSGNTLKFYKNNVSTDFIFKDNNNAFSGSSSILVVDTGGTISQKYANSFGLFNALSSVTIDNTSTETSIISSVLTGSTTLLASTNAYNPELGVGRKFRFNAKGTIQTDNSSVDNLTVNLKISSTTIATSSAFLVNQGIAANTYFEINTTFTIRNSGLVICSGSLIGGSNITRTPDKIIHGIYSQNATISTTADQIFDCTVKFDQANANNIITITESTLEILN